MTTKTCKRCNQTSLLNEFHNNSTKEDGLAEWCKECSSKDYKNRYYADKDKFQAISAMNYIKNRSKNLATMTANRKIRRIKHPLYMTWSGIKKRCYNKNHEAYKNYGGRGISICDRWQTFSNFEEDINKLLGPRPENYTLDRINNDGNYELNNIRWVNRKGQAANRRPRKL